MFPPRDDFVTTPENLNIEGDSALKHNSKNLKFLQYAHLKLRLKMEGQ